MERWKDEEMDEKSHYLEEERRLFYVAVTRTKEKLYLFSTEKRQSKFIAEIEDKQCVKDYIKTDIPEHENNVVEEFYKGDITKENLILSASKFFDSNENEIYFPQIESKNLMQNIFYENKFQDIDDYHIKYKRNAIEN